MDQDKDILMMSRKEIKRYQVIRKVLDKQIKQKEAAEYFELSPRQVRRIVKRVKAQGEQGVIHRLRGKEGNRKTVVSFKRKVLELYQKNYWDFGPTLASEKLFERDGVKINDETLRLWLIKEGLWQGKKRQAPKERSRRERKGHFGQMVQMDGSHHDWLEGRGPKLVLMGYIDDATNRFYGQFYDYEGTMPAMGGLKGYIKRNGLPASIYLDRHSTYKTNKQERYTDWPFRDEEELTQFGRACKQLGIELIFAHSPQAKGRVERVFRTLQDRLSKELRLSQANSLEEANYLLKSYLPIFNKKFEVSAKGSGDFHRPVDKRVDIDGILSIQTERFLRNDRTVLHHKQWYQILSRTRAQRVVVYEYLNGQIGIGYGKDRLAFKTIRGSKDKVIPVKRKVLPPNRHVPPQGSYWRDGFKLKGSLTSKRGHF
jgi:(2Fe-2S) ferredoxin